LKAKTTKETGRKVADAMLLLQRWRAVWAERLETIDHLVQLARRAGCRVDEL
jgi:hypothetical protein